MRNVVFIIFLCVPFLLTGQNDTIKKDSIFRMSLAAAISDLKANKNELSKNIERSRLNIFSKYKQKQIKIETINKFLSEKKDSLERLNIQIDVLSDSISNISNELKDLSLINEKAAKEIKERDSLITVKKSKYNQRYAEILTLENRKKFINAGLLALELKCELSLQPEMFSLIIPSFALKNLDSVIIRNEGKYIVEVRNNLNNLIRIGPTPSDNMYVPYYQNRIKDLEKTIQLTSDENLKNDALFNSKASRYFILEAGEIKSISELFIKIYQFILGDSKTINCNTIIEYYKDLSFIQKPEHINEVNFLKNLVSCYYNNVTKSNSMKLLGRSLDEIKSRMVEYPSLYKDKKQIEIFCKETPECIK